MAKTHTPLTADRDDPVAGGTGTGGIGDGEGDTSAAGGKSGVPGGVLPLSRAQRLRQQSNMSFWLILKKKNDLQAKAARVQELRSTLEKIR